MYCHAEGILEHNLDEISVDDIVFIASTLRTLGIDKFKLTGGEPLLRNDIVTLISRLAELKPRDLSITTNGYMLIDLAEELSEAGLMRVNVNLPSLKRAVYAYVTGVDALHRVVKGLVKASDVGLKVKLNYVVLKNINAAELPKLVDFASSLGADINLIELEPISLPQHFFEKYFVKAPDVLKSISRRVAKKWLRLDLHSRPVLLLDNGVKIEVISWVNHAAFCMRCSRLRLTSDGKLRYCIADPQAVDLRRCLAERSSECVRKALAETISIRRPFWINGSGGSKRST